MHIWLNEQNFINQKTCDGEVLFFGYLIRLFFRSLIP